MPTAQPRTAEYTLRMVWSTGTDADTSAYDDVSRYHLTPPGVSVDGLGRDQIRAFAPPATPALDCTLTNHDGRFSPGGPLAGFVSRGPATTYAATWGQDVLADAADVTADDPTVLANGTWEKTLFTGAIDTAPQNVSRPERTVQVRALGTISLLADKRPRTTLYESIRTDQAIAVILDAVGWPAGLRSLDTGDTTLLYWWLDGSVSALQAIETLLATEGAGACAYQDGDGVFHFEGRQYRQNATRSLTSQWTFFDGRRGRNATADDPTVLADDPNVLANGPLDDLLFHVVPAEWRSNPDEVVSSVRATVNTRTPTSTQKIWELGGPVTLAANETLDLEATSSDPFKDAVTPLSGTDYSVSAGSLVGVTLLETSGQRARIRLVAGSGGATVIGVTSNGIQVRAVSLPVTTSTEVTSTVDTSLADARARPKDLTLDLWPEIERNQALDIVNSMARRYQRERPQMVIRVANLDAAHMYAILAARVSDRVTIVHGHAGINGAWWIEQIDHAVEAGRLHVMTLGCERVFDVGGAQWGIDRWDLSTWGE